MIDRASISFPGLAIVPFEERCNFYFFVLVHAASFLKLGVTQEPVLHYYLVGMFSFPALIRIIANY